jgi:hypothetical protein
VDPPLYEFVTKREELMVGVAKLPPADIKTARYANFDVE